MPLAADSPEFHRLTTRWLDDLATPAEAAALWLAVRDDAACAAEFCRQTKFELLLEDTLHRSGAELAVARQADKYQRRARIVRVARIAAVVAVLGVVVWMIVPRQAAMHEVASSKPAKPAALPPTVPETRRTLSPTTLFVPARAEAKAAAARLALPARMDAFFLASANIDRMPLWDAIATLEAQMRALNLQHAPELNALHIVIPAAAANREVTFVSGPISFLKAVRAVAALAGLDVRADDAGIALVLPAVQPSREPSTQSADALLAEAKDARSAISDVLNDARALGMNIDVRTRLITGTPAQFAALREMSEARAQIHSLPPQPLLIFAMHTDKPAPDKVLSDKEAKDELERARQAGLIVQTLVVQPGTNPQSPAAGHDYQMIVSPAGESGQIITISPVLALEAPPSAGIASAGIVEPLDLIAPPGGGGSFSLPLVQGRDLNISAPVVTTTSSMPSPGAVGPMPNENSTATGAVTYNRGAAGAASDGNSAQTPAFTAAGGGTVSFGGIDLLGSITWSGNVLLNSNNAAGTFVAGTQVNGGTVTVTIIVSDTATTTSTNPP